MKQYIVDTVLTFHIKYLIAKPEDDRSLEECMDVTTCEDAEELCQTFLDEKILGYKEVNDKQLEEELEDTYLANWDLEHVKRVFTKVVK